MYESLAECAIKGNEEENPKTCRTIAARKRYSAMLTGVWACGNKGVGWWTSMVSSGGSRIGKWVLKSALFRCFTDSIMSTVD